MNPFNGKNKKPLIVVTIILVLAGLWLFLFKLDFGEGKPVYGVTFSQKYAQEELGLDWQKTYLAILDELKVSHIRLIAYWDEVESQLDQFDFTALDWQVEQAASRNVSITLVVGRRAPRWPECHDPAWLANLAPLARQQQQLEYLKAVVERYKENSAIIAWQVENEPFLASFGECPWPDKNFFRQEVDLVKTLDSRLVIITDSGELGSWQQATGQADILGTTLYRIVWNKYFGFLDYNFLPPAFYHFKASLTKFFHPNLEKVIVTELQMEPWTMDKQMVELTLEEQQLSFDSKRFKDNITYVEKTGFTEVYLWGVEYWYWLKQQGYPEIWQEAMTLWQ